MTLERVDLAETFSRVREHWVPKVVGELNGQMVKLVRFQGEFVWHHHDLEDEMFLVVAGEFRMELRDRNVSLEAGQFLIVPRGVEHRPVAEREALAPLAPKLASYALSYLFLGIYWSNHHHLLQAVRHVDGRILWANLHLLFWLSLIPFTTAWVGEAHLDSTAVAAYGVVLLLAGGAYFILSRLLVARHGSDSPLARAVGDDTKGRISLVMYVAAVTLAFPLAWGALAIYV